MKVEKTVSITIGEQTTNVVDLKPEVVQLIDLFDEWRQREADTASELVLVRSALQQLQSQIVAAVQPAPAAEGTPPPGVDLMADATE